jgi:hypothetical protein
MFLDKLIILMSLLDPWVLVFLLSLSHNTTSLHDIIIDVPLDRLAHPFNLSLISRFNLAINFFACGFLVSKSLFLSFIKAIADNVFRLKVSKRNFFGFDELLHTFSKLRCGLVPLSSVCEIIS